MAVRSVCSRQEGTTYIDGMATTSPAPLVAVTVDFEGRLDALALKTLLKLPR
jgi:hypothetical protein